jgi:radical SAM superfamily enzyme YgiQ (UPF0313 family)
LHKNQIILIALSWTREKDPRRALGHASLLGALQQHEVTVIENSWSTNKSDFSVDKVVSFIAAHSNKNTFIALGAFVWNEVYIQAILTQIKEQEIPGKIILGGPQVSYLQSKHDDIEDLCSGILEKHYPQVDIFIRGYAEMALVDFLLSAEAKPKIKGIHYANQVDKNELAVVQLDHLESPLLMGLIQPTRFLRWETKRGCCFRCAFCQHQSPEANKVYQFSLDRVLAEAKWICEHPKIDDVAVVDPTFNIKTSHYMAVLNALVTHQYRGKVSLQCRLEFVTPEFLKAINLLKETANVVLEFGVQTTNKEEQAIIKRSNNLKKVSQVLLWLYLLKIKSEISLIYGLPNQTIKTFITSIEFCVRYRAPFIIAFPLMLLPGSELHAKKSKYQLVEDDDAMSRVISGNSFTQSDWRVMKWLADSLVRYNELSLKEQPDWAAPLGMTNHEFRLQTLRNQFFIKAGRCDYQREMLPHASTSPIKHAICTLEAP